MERNPSEQVRELARLGRDYSSKQVGIVAISSNDAEAFPDDAPEQPVGYQGVGGEIDRLSYGPEAAS